MTTTKFHHSLQRQGQTCLVKLSGVIDEDNELAALGDQIDGRTVVIDLAGVERINSCGVRDWVKWIADVEARGIRVVLVSCSPAIVAQINLVDNFLGAAVVKSFYAPYFCPECDKEKALLCQVEDLGAPPRDPPRCRCDDCDQVMEFDDMADSYFAFLAGAADPELLAELGGVVQEAAVPEESSRIRTRGSARSPLPSIPTLPASDGGGSRAFGIPETETPPRPRLRTRPPSAPAPVRPERSGGVGFAVLGLLIAALGVVAYLLLR